MNIFNLFKKQENKEQNYIIALNYAIQTNISFANNDYANALKQINKAISYNPENDKFFYQRAILYIKMQKYNNALTDINTAININPKIYYYYLVRADIYNFLKNTLDEIKDIKYAKELMPKAYLYYNRKLDMEKVKGNKETAEYFFNRMQKIKQI